MGVPVNKLSLADNLLALCKALFAHKSDANGHNLASQTKAGFMSSTDKAKLDALGTGEKASRKVTSQTLTTALTADTSWTVPSHTVGSKELAVYIDGLLCTAGVEYKDASATTVTFTSDIPVGFTLTAEVVN